MSAAPIPEKVPPATELFRALTVAVYVFVITFLTGLIAHGFDIDHLSNAKHAGEAAIAALLGTLGFEALHIGRRMRDAGRPMSDPTII